MSFHDNFNTRGDTGPALKKNNDCVLLVYTSTSISQYWASGGPTCLRSGTWSLGFYGVPPSHPACCYWLGATHVCPKVDDQKRPKHCKIRKSRQRAGSLQIQIPVHTSSHKWLRGIIFVWGFTLFFFVLFFFRKLLLVIPFMFILQLCPHHTLLHLMFIIVQYMVLGPYSQSISPYH